MELTEQDLEMIRETHDKVIRIDTLLGNGEKGLCYDVRRHQKAISQLTIQFWLLVGLLIGTGILAVVSLQVIP